MTLLLADTSVWHRVSHPGLSSRWLQLLTDDRIAVCPQVRLEVLYSARSPKDYQRTRELLEGVHQLDTPSSCWERAEETQARLARRSLHHRAAGIADLVIAATAEHHGATVLHYDGDFDVIASVTGQATEWAARRGSLA
jgi:predicted nucleic acid-binding protein